jgi:HPt (histidine-containing phosphotransfer) domain-containing protein
MSDPVADFAGVLKRIGGDRELLGEVLHIFLDIAPEMMREMEEAVTSRNQERILTLAHDLRGAAANVGAAELARQANLLEMSARQGFFDHVGEHHELLRQELQKVCQSIKAYLHP